MMTLVELLAAKRGDSWDKFAKRAGISPATAHKYGAGKNADVPTVETINALARACDVPPGLIVLAAAQGIGVDMDRVIEGSALGRALPDDVDELPPYAQRLILDTAQALLAAWRGQQALPEPTDDEAGIPAEMDDIARAARRRVERATSGRGTPRRRAESNT
ncbi:hypothetical protein Val02_68900 [Virgisporangium aliadipatigenens]|uniref:HTH cro/C1-type domain-containing protein n=1 Tax=Virgisporangium aliadipatigenens TaxID=741659 RepID=A0A8J4DTQ6_9ACTN|nr:helix-turn-helix transcriptional regulator [Virgisporangium aliadipatigenens]GIJ50004.1 hypothetical protein Val02_68900 [Virgisporangium aliadipatigenens]